MTAHAQDPRFATSRVMEVRQFPVSKQMPRKLINKIITEVRDEFRAAGHSVRIRKYSMDSISQPGIKLVRVAVFSR